MGFSDKWVSCPVCGREYVFTVEIQRHHAQVGQSLDEVPPCPDCAPRSEAGLPRPKMRLDPVTGHWVGTVKWFDLEKGYGFIDRGDGNDIFVHRTALVDSPVEYVEGQHVTYDVEETLRGPQAVDVRLFAAP